MDFRIEYLKLLPGHRVESKLVAEERREAQYVLRVWGLSGFPNVLEELAELC